MWGIEVERAFWDASDLGYLTDSYCYITSIPSQGWCAKGDWICARSWRNGFYQPHPTNQPKKRVLKTMIGSGANKWWTVIKTGSWMLLPRIWPFRQPTNYSCPVSRGVHFSVRDRIGPARTGPVLFGPVLGPDFCQIRSGPELDRSVWWIGLVERNWGNLFIFFARMEAARLCRVARVDRTCLSSLFIFDLPSFSTGTAVPSGTGRPSHYSVNC